MRKSIFIILSILLSLIFNVKAEVPLIEGSEAVPDLTKGGELTRINKRWAGPLGIYCGAWRPRQGKNDDLDYVRQLLVMEIDKGSPADGVLKVGDVILGADGTGATEVPDFKGGEWMMIPLANAITDAEKRNPATQAASREDWLPS